MESVVIEGHVSVPPITTLPTSLILDAMMVTELATNRS
jgi:hypothetical protein